MSGVGVMLALLGAGLALAIDDPLIGTGAVLALTWFCVAWGME